MDNLTNRRINKLFTSIGQQIYKNDIDHNDTKSWWPIRPPLLDSLIVEFIFQELIRLFRKADQVKISEESLSKSFGSKEVIHEIQLLWPSLAWSSNTISYEDKMYLIQRLLNITDLSSTNTNFNGDTFDKLAEQIKRSGDDSIKNVLTTGIKIYFGYLKSFYELINEDWQKAESKAIKASLGKTLMNDPGPWGQRNKDFAIRQIVRNCDFRREKLRDLDRILKGEPGVPGIVEGIVGENIVVAIKIPNPIPKVDGFITNADPFKDEVVGYSLMEEGIAVVSRTGNGTKVLKRGQKVTLDGTSGTVYNTL